MKVLFKGLFLFIFLSSFLYALEVKKGWNFVGTYKETTLSKFKQELNLDKAYVLRNNKWVADATVHLNEGILIYAKKDFYLNFRQNKYEIISTIKVKQGWNFKALSMKVSISSDVFESGSVVYTYKGKSTPWEMGKKSKNSLILESMQGFFIYSSKPKTYDLDALSLKLENFNTTQSMNNFIEKIIIKNKNFKSDDDYRYNGAYPLAEASTLSSPIAQSSPSSDMSKIKQVSNATHTNNQVSNVDEADILKHNGKDIFYINGNSLYVQSFDEVIKKDKAKEVQIFKYQKGVNPVSLYINDNKLIVIANNQSSYIYRSYVMPPSNQDNNTYIEIYDISDINNISLLNKIKIQGLLIQSRLVDNKVYLVSRFNPYFKVEYALKNTQCSPYKFGLEVDSREVCRVTDYNKYSIKEKHITPYIEIDDKKSELLEAKSFFASIRVKYSKNIITTIVLDLDDINSFEKISMMVNSDNIYMNEKSLYFWSNYYPINHNWDNGTIKTMIYKVSLKNNLSYIGNILIKGKAINQFAFDEYNDALRVATTTGSSFRNNTDNMITVIKEENKQLKQVGYLNKLGKQGESIKSVRFMKTKGYVVTFKQTDPFYTIDLSIASNPRKVGQLFISGFSTYLHDVGGGKILALGNSADDNGRVNGMKVQLFDVSNFARPKVLDTFSFDLEFRSNSLYNHKAFSYRDSDKLFAMPISSYKSKFYGFYVFDVKNKKIKKRLVINNKQYSYNARSVIFSKEDKDYLLMLNNKLSVKEIP